MRECNKEQIGIKEIFAQITGSRATGGFGEPFISMFSTFATTKEAILPAAYICTLFLSAIFKEFPTEKLHTFTRYARDNYSLPGFDCKMYERLYASQREVVYENVMLMDNDGHTLPRNCSKQDIFEAFDFYTNR